METSIMQDHVPQADLSGLISKWRVRLLPSWRLGLSRWRGGRYRVGELRDFRNS